MPLGEWKTDVYTAHEEGAWASFSITGSLVQGNVEAHLVFCLLMANALHLAHHDPAITPQARAAWWYWIYVDDCVIQADPMDLIDVFRAVYHALAHFNLHLQPPKCAAHHPAHQGRDPPDILQPFLTTSWGEAGTIGYDHDGLTILGTEACAGRATPLHAVGAQAARQVAQRAQKATVLATAISDMIRLCPPAGACQAAWAMLTSIVCHSLTYDSRVMPCSLVLPHARVVEHAVLQTLQVIIGIREGTLTAKQLLQVGLPTRHGGLEVHLPTRTCILARAASLIEHGPTLRAALRRRMPTADVHTLDGIGSALAEGLADNLAALGILALGPGGSPLAERSETPPPEQFRPHVPLRHLQSHYQLHVVAHTHRALLASADIAEAIRIRSAGGNTAGTCLTAPLQHGGLHLADSAF